jgi:hypothetical protein
MSTVLHQLQEESRHEVYRLSLSCPVSSLTLFEISHFGGRAEHFFEDFFPLDGSLTSVKLWREEDNLNLMMASCQTSCTHCLQHIHCLSLERLGPSLSLHGLFPYRCRTRSRPCLAFDDRVNDEDELNGKLGDGVDQRFWKSETFVGDQAGYAVQEPRGRSREQGQGLPNLLGWGIRLRCDVRENRG